MTDLVSKRDEALAKATEMTHPGRPVLDPWGMTAFIRGELVEGYATEQETANGILELLTKISRWQHIADLSNWHICPSSDPATWPDGADEDLAGRTDCTCWVRPAQRDVLSALARIWADRPGYRQEWIPR